VASYTPIQIALNDTPRAIVKAMDDLVLQQQANGKISARRRPLPGWLLLLGLLLIVGDWLFGYHSHVFLIAALLCWGIAIFTWFRLRRLSQSGDFAPRYQITREIVYTLRDDMAPGRPLFGQVDLTGTEQPSKVARSGTNVLGAKLNVYRDEWLTLKAKLYDGNMLRFSAIERSKVRMGFWKKGSRRNKWKSAVNKGRLQELKVRVSVNPQAYEIGGMLPTVGKTKAGAFLIEQCDTGGGIITLILTTNAVNLTANDFLGALKLAYSFLQRKAVVTAEGAPQ
jgi:hypothetical protein